MSASHDKSKVMRLWIVERRSAFGWYPVQAWARFTRAEAYDVVAGLMKNGGYMRRNLRVKAWVRA